MADDGTVLGDRFGRRISYLRVSVTDRCDLRCVYCMTEKMRFLPRAQLLSLEELRDVAAAFVSLGVVKLRITGGEPLVRHGVLGLLHQLGELPGLGELVLTTNGTRLAQCAVELRAAGVRRVNISLDSLRADRFRKLTRYGELGSVLGGVDAALAAGFERVKLNSVILRGRNDDEVLDLVDFARVRGCDISFIEEMPLGEISDHDRALSFCPSAELRAKIERRYPLSVSTESSGGPARYYRMGDSATRIGFISPHSENFCASCNRVRLMPDGRLLLCLGHEHSVDLRVVVRRYPGDSDRLCEAICAAMALKPERHDFRLDEAPTLLRFMNASGG